jgi:serine/threonine protein kinase
LTVARQAANALEAAHAAGVIHRDVKPQNLLFTGRGHNVWISDFGICLIRGRDRPTETGEVVGPHGFMAPELKALVALGQFSHAQLDQIRNLNSRIKKMSIALALQKEQWPCPAIRRSLL